MRSKTLVLALTAFIIAVSAMVAHAETASDLMQKEQAASKLFDDADALLIQKNDDAALVKYNEILNTYPDSLAAPVAMIRIANIQRSNKQFAESIATFNKIVAKYPDTSFAAQAMFNIANIYEETTDMQQAIDKYQEISDKYPNSENQNITNVVSQAKTHHDNLQNSVTLIKEKIKQREERIVKLKTYKMPPDQLEKMMVDNYINLVDLYSMVNKKNEAIKCLEKALEEYPNNKILIINKLKGLHNNE